MDTTQLSGAIFTKIINHKKLIIIISIIGAVLFFIDAKITKPEYTSEATVFPLSNPTENSLSSGALSSILGMADASKSFSGDASINIIELALSRNIREATAATRLSGKWENKTIAEILIDQQNKSFSFFKKKIEMPKDSMDLAVTGGKLLYPNLAARLNRNGVLELNYTNTDESLVTPVSDIIISKISQFYINLRTQKATLDYNFTLKKVDSLQKVLNGLDEKAVNMQATTMFTPGDKLLYSLPKENLGDEKLRVGHERDIAINNREEALWRLQKVTPIVAILDKPDPPFDVQKASGIIYAIVGFILVMLLTILVLISGLIYRYIKEEIYKAMTRGQDQFSSDSPKPNS